jgi:hypothetical protein
MSRSLGKVDLLGLNAYGQNPGLSPLWGTLIGGGVSGASTMLARHSGSGSGVKYAEGIGLGAGLATAGVMYAMKSTRHAALGAALGAAFASGIALLERLLFGTITAPAAAVVPAAGGTAGLGIPQINALNGLGIPMARDLNGLGVPMIAERTAPAGTIPGVAGNQLASPGASMPPVSLLGPMSPQASHLRGIGGPAVHGLSAAYGATLLGGGRG